MRIGHTVLLAIAILSTTDASTPLTSSRANRINIASRYLRFEQEEVDSEERNAVEKITKLFNSKAKPPKIPDKKKITETLKITTSQKLIDNAKKNNKSPTEAFALLKLDDAGENLLSNPKFKTWLTYVDETVKVQTKSAMIATLTAKYGDDGLARLIQAAKNGRESKLADMLQTEQMWVWLTGTKSKSTDDIFHLLKLDEGVDKVLTNPNLQAWDDYIKFYNSKFEVKNPTTTFDSLKRLYGDEKMAKMLEAAKKEPTTRKIATEFQTVQFTQWLREGTKPAQIWKMLNMYKPTWKSNPDADVWRGYLAFYKLHSR